MHVFKTLKTQQQANETHKRKNIRMYTSQEVLSTSQFVWTFDKQTEQRTRYAAGPQKGRNPNHIEITTS